MPQPDRPRGHVTGRVTIAVVVAAIACCGIPLLVAAGLLTTTGLGLRNPVLVGGGVAVAAWLIVRVARRALAQRRGHERSLHE
ncbi:MAG: hypothetical protein ACR2KP_02265 [Egibacteraceae bacterium]